MTDLRLSWVILDRALLIVMSLCSFRASASPCKRKKSGRPRKELPVPAVYLEDEHSQVRVVQPTSIFGCPHSSGCEVIHPSSCHKTVPRWAHLSCIDREGFEFLGGKPPTIVKKSELEIATSLYSFLYFCVLSFILLVIVSTTPFLNEQNDFGFFWRQCPS